MHSCSQAVDGNVPAAIFSEEVDDGVIALRQFFAAVHGEEDEVGMFEREQRLAVHILLKTLVIGSAAHAARVEEQKIHRLRRNVVRHVVARGAGYGTLNRFAFSDEAVEERGFACIRPADNGDSGQLRHEGSVPCALLFGAA